MTAAVVRSCGADERLGEGEAARAIAGRGSLAPRAENFPRHKAVLPQPIGLRSGLWAGSTGDVQDGSPAAV